MNLDKGVWMHLLCRASYVSDVKVASFVAQKSKPNVQEEVHNKHCSVLKKKNR